MHLILFPTLLMSVFLCAADTYLLCEGPESYHYLSQSGCVHDSSLNDKQLFDSVMVGAKREKNTQSFNASPPDGTITLHL